MATAEEMDRAARRAAEDLAVLKRDHPEAVTLLIEWWKRYYVVAGHKRLGRALLGQQSPAGGED